MRKLYLLFLLALLPFVVYADPVEINGLYYSLSSEGATVVHHGYCHYSGSIVIPSTVTYGNTTYKVTSIASRAFYFESVTSVIIGNNVKTIGSEAFYLCNEMTSLTIGKRVTDIGEGAFNRCDLLQSVTIPNSVKNMGNNVFRDCRSLTSVTIGKNVRTIGDNAFYNCTKLKSVIIPDSVKYIGDYTFWYCSNLASVTIGKSVSSIGQYAFNNCKSIKSVSIPKKVNSIGDGAFCGCTGMLSVIIGNGVKTIGENAFQGCSSLTSVTFGDSVNSILENAFKNCSKLKSLTLPNSVKTIGENAFYECNSLTSLTLGNSVETIADNAFCFCDKLESLTIPNSVKTIGMDAFYNCSSLTSLTIGDGVTSIGESSFENCTSLSFLSIGKSVTSIGQYAFWNHPKLPYIISKIADPKAISDMTFWNKSVELVVPSGSLVRYQETLGWKDFKNIVEDITLSESELIIKRGKSVTLIATVHPSALNDKSLTWKSSNAKVAQVSDDGRVTGFNTGTATITCTSVASGAKTTCKVTVGTVVLNKKNLFLEKDKSETLSPTVYPRLLSDKSVTWKSSNTKIATVTSRGKVKGVKYGTATITCTSVATGLKTTCKVTVGNVLLDQKEVAIKKGKSLTLTAKVYPSTLADKSLKWESSNTKYATVSSDGKVTGVKVGTATITCTSVATGLSTTCKVTIGAVTLDQKEVAIKKGKTVTLTPTVYPSSLEDKSVTWKSSDETVATVSTAGKVKGIKYGTATITCTSNATGLSATCKVTVGYVKLDQTEATVLKGKTVTLKATVYPSTLTDKTVTWESSNTAVATVTSSGKVKGVKAGTATITCTSVATGLTATSKITVTASSGTRSIDGDDEEVTGIDEVNVEPAEIEPFDVYDLSGRKVLNKVTSLDGLPNGIYIVNGKKMLKKD